MTYEIQPEIKNGVYCIMNILDRKKYVGSSVNLSARYRKHKELLIKNKHHCSYLQSAVNKHGIENFRFVLLARCEPGLGKYLEKTYLDYGKFEYNSTKNVIFKEAPSVNRNFSPKQVKQIKWLYAEDYSPKSIAEKFGCTNRTIYSIVNREVYLDVSGKLACPELTSGLEKKKIFKSLSDDKVRAIRHLLTLNYSQRELAETLSISKSTVTEINNGKGRFGKIPTLGGMCSEILKIKVSVNNKKPKGWQKAKEYNKLYVQEAYELYRKGESLNMLGKKYGVARHTIKRSFKRSNLNL